MAILVILYAFIMFGVLIGGFIYCDYVYGRETELEKSLRKITEDYYSSYF